MSPFVERAQRERERWDEEDASERVKQVSSELCLERSVSVCNFPCCMQVKQDGHNHPQGRSRQSVCISVRPDERVRRAEKEKEKGTRKVVVEWAISCKPAMWRPVRIVGRENRRSDLNLTKARAIIPIRCLSLSLSLIE